MKVNIGIVTFNNANEQLQRLLESISASYDVASKTAEVALSITGIDNGAACITESIKASKLSHGIGLQTLDSVGNVGFGTAMNMLLKQAFDEAQTKQPSDLFIAVNPDGLFHLRCLSELMAAASVSTAALLEARQFPEEHPKPYARGTGETLWATGACLAVPANIYKTIGGFDENLFMYGEDVDLSWRARAAGFRVKLVHDAIFVHPTLGRVWSREAKKHFFLSAIYLAYKWGAGEFTQLYEDDYRSRFGQNEEDLRLLKTAIEKGKQSSSEIVNTTNFKPHFDKNRSFSQARWGY